MPLDMPESVLVRFKGKMQPGVTLRDLVHAIPLYAIKAGLLTVEKKGKKNIFSGRILEIEGLPDLKVEQAFELSDASAERSASGCTIKLNKEPIAEYLRSNIVLMKNMIANGYQDRRTLERRIKSVEAWLAKPDLLEADKDAEYAAVIEIDLADIKEPIVCLPQRPGRRQVHVRSLGHQDRRGLYWLLHDQHRSLPCRSQGPRGPARHSGSSLGSASHQDGPERADQRGLLQHLWSGRCAYRDSGLLAVHGQPGSGSRGRHGHLDFHA